MRVFLIALRWAYAATSWFLAVGLLTLMVRTELSGHAQGFALMAVAFIVNGFLVKPIRQTSDQR